MTRDQALYFLEGMTAGIASPSSELAKRLYVRLVTEHDLIAAEFEIIRPEIDGYLDEAEGEVEADLTNLIKIGRMVRG